MQIFRTENRCYAAIFDALRFFEWQKFANVKYFS